jgi:hypothetical protein
MSELASPSPDVANRLAGSHRQFLAFLERRLGDRALAEDSSSILLEVSAAASLSS